MLNRYFLSFGAASGLLLLATAAPARAQAPALTTISPAANARAVPRNAPVVATFSQSLSAGSAGALKVFSRQRGGLRGGGSAAVAGSTLTFAPVAYDFRPGETVQYTLTTAAGGAGGALAAPRVGQFTTAVGGTGRGLFAGSVNEVFANSTRTVVTGDVDGDGDQDLVTGEGVTRGVSIRFNNGNGTFASEAVVPIGETVYGAQLGDVDGDGDLDLLTLNTAASRVTVCFNTNGSFAGGRIILGFAAAPNGLTLGDVDGDGDLDLVTAHNNQTLSISPNNGHGAYGFGRGHCPRSGSAG